MRKSYTELRKAISYDSLIKELRCDFSELKDHRAANTVHSLADVLMSGYAIFMMKYPSLLSFEQQTPLDRRNLQNLFGISKVCSDVQMRRILDEVDPADLQSLFPKRFDQLRKLGVLKDYRFMRKYLLISIDGVHFFESHNIHCKRCLVKQQRNGEVAYSHSMLSATLVHPDRREVFTLGGEAIQKQDGATKNDCELNASKRLQSMLYESYQGQPFMIVEDALYANAPHIQQIQDNGWDFILNVKPTSHKALFALFEGRKQRKQIKQHAYKKGKSTYHLYWMNNVPLNGKGNLRVHFLHCEEHLANGKVKRFSFICSIPLNKSNAPQIMRAGRARWKIENEQFNTLKNQGYHFEHNYGHGHNHLCNVMAQLMLLAFFIDQMIQAFHQTFNWLWTKIKAKKRLWERIRAIYFTHLVNSFNELFDLIVKLVFTPKRE